MKKVLLIFLFIVALCIQSNQALDDGLVTVPPLGWSSWNLFWCNTDCKKQPDLCISEKNIKEIALSMVTSGLKDVGYQYINIDDCYLSRNRDPQTQKLLNDPVNFPSGMKALGDYIHSKGLKYGMYNDVGTATCQGFPGSKNHFALDVQTFKEWGVDYLKMDGCNEPSSDYKADYTTVHTEIKNQDAKIILECSWPAYIMKADEFDWMYLRSICHTWRTYGDDIRDSWQSLKPIIQYWATQDIAKYSGPGAFHMADFLTVGQGGMTWDEYRTQFTLWAMWSSPIVLGTDIRKLNKDVMDIIANKEVIQEVSQDPLVKQAVKVRTINTSVDVWVKELQKAHTYAIAFVNMSDNQNLNGNIKFMDILSNVQQGLTFDVRDLWQLQDVAKSVDNFTSKQLKPHECQLIKVSLAQKSLRKEIS